MGIFRQLRGLLLLFLCILFAKAQAQEQAKHTQAPGHYHQVQMGISFGQGGNIREQFGLLSGYQFNQRFGVGLGVNYDRYDRTTALPVYLQPRLYLFNKNTGLYGFGDLGWALGWQNHDQSTEFIRTRASGGFMGQAGLGYQLNFAKAALNFMLGLKLQKTQINTEYWWYTYSPTSGEPSTELERQSSVAEDRQYRRVAFSMGILF